jgi:hypothetical protein
MKWSTSYLTQILHIRKYLSIIDSHKKSFILDISKWFQKTLKM